MKREQDDLDKKLQQFPRHKMSEESRKEIHDTLMKTRMSRMPKKKKRKTGWAVGLASVAVLFLFTVLGLSFFQGGLDKTADENRRPDNANENESVEDNDTNQDDDESGDNNDSREEPRMNEDEDPDPEPGYYDPEEVSKSDYYEEGTGYEKALENLELPYIYENTLVYNGTMNPEQSIRFELSMKNTDNTIKVEPDVSSDGHFSVALNSTALEAGDELIVWIMGDMPHERKFKLPIQPQEEGMDVVPRKPNTIKAIEDGTKLPDFYQNTGTYRGETMPGSNVLVSETRAGETMDLDIDEDGAFHEDFSNFPYVAKGEANRTEGDKLLFMITNGHGYSTYVEKEVLPASDSPDYTVPEEELDDIREVSDKIIDALDNEDMQTVSEYVDPEKGLTFSPYVYVMDDAVKFDKEDVPTMLAGPEEFDWGDSDGKGEPIELTPEDYFDEFMDMEPYQDPDDVLVDDPQDRGNTKNNIKDVFPDATVIEYYNKGSDEYAGIDWESVNLVYEENDAGDLQLVAIVRDMWTI